MTYNIRNGRGADGRVDLVRVAAVIESFAPDVVALQEVDVCRGRSGGLDQASELGRRLGMEARFSPCLEYERDGRSGIATLARVPIGSERYTELPHSGVGRRSEPRRALVTELCLPGGEPIEFVNTHLSVIRAERARQLQSLVGTLGIGEVVVAGDLNCGRRSLGFRALNDLECAATHARSWPARLPVLQLDHLLYRGRLQVRFAGAWSGGGARRASDHLPVVAAFSLDDSSLDQETS